jgi:hydroxylysine kinase
MSTPPSVLQSDAPTMSMEQAAQVLMREYGLVAQSLASLDSERDQNFKVETAQGKFVLKFANAAEPSDVTQLQTQALLHVARVAPEVPVQRVVPCLSGAAECHHAGSMVRLVTWLEGLPQHMSKRHPGQGKSLGAGLAKLGVALSTLEFAGGEQDLQWDIFHALRLREKLDAVDGAWRGQVADVLNRFERYASPVLASARRQFIHNDFNPYNVLVSAENPDLLAGILDLGDIVRTPLICDPAIAMAYQLLPGLDPLDCLRPFLSAYARVCPLAAAEINILPELVLARIATTITITSWRAKAYPENRDYILRSVPGATKGLAALGELPREHVIAEFNRAIAGDSA